MNQQKIRRVAPPFDGIEENYQRSKALRGLGNGTAHLHLIFWRSDLPHRWVLVCEPRRNDVLCRTKRCIPLSWNQPLFRPRQGGHWEWVRKDGIETPRWIRD